MIIRARIILPDSSPPIEDGGMVIAGNTIRCVCSFRDLKSMTRSKVVDLGDSVVLPGLINAHCHLDYTDMAGLLSPPGTFLDWIGTITSIKSSWSYSDYARSWLNGSKQLQETGVTTVADIESMPDLLPEVWHSTPLRLYSFLEMTGILSRRPPYEILAEARDKIDALKHRRNRAMLSPHAPYSTRPELLRQTMRLARKRSLRIACHVAESAEEFEMFRHARGRMFQWLSRNGRDNADCGSGSPVAHLARNKLLGENVLAVHVNYLAPGDATLLGKNKTHVVHCPQSHDFFRHAPFPRRRLAAAGVNLCLGTDSLATTRKIGREKPRLNLLQEMSLLAKQDPGLSPREILEMATLNGAKALGLSGRIGQLSQGFEADWVAIPFNGSAQKAMEAVIHHPGKIQAGMIGGNWTVPPE